MALYSAKHKKNLNRHRRYPVIRECKGVEIGLESLARLGAHSVGIGRKCVKGEPTETLCLRYYVAAKRPSSKLSSDETIPKRIDFVSRKTGKTARIETDIIELPPPRFEAVDPESVLRPVPGGCSGGANSHAGTIGGWAWDATDDTIVMLSNDHVFGHVAGDPIVQPATSDGGVLPKDRIGEVKRGMARSNTVVNNVDCSIGDPDGSDVYDPKVIEIGPGVFAIDTAEADMLVEKFGQTTGHTFGEIDDTDWSGTVSGRPFGDCFLVNPKAPTTDWSGGGDSGSLVFSQEVIDNESGIKPVVGLHFAGAGNFGIACKIENVFSALDLKTLCAGAFAAFFDGLFEAESTGEVSEETETGLRAISALAARRVPRLWAPRFVRRERRTPGSLFRGISRELHDRVTTTVRGRTVSKFVHSHRVELLTMLAKDGDIRRATVAAFQPLVAGTTTTTDVLERVLTADDLKALDKLAAEVSRKAGPPLQAGLKILQALKTKAEGKSLAGILGIQL